MCFSVGLYTAVADLHVTSYSGSVEIRQYFERVAEKYQLNKYIKFMCEVVEAKWLESQQWSVTVRTGSNDTMTVMADFLVNGGGIVK